MKLNKVIAPIAIFVTVLVCLCSLACTSVVGFAVFRNDRINSEFEKYSYQADYRLDFEEFTLLATVEAIVDEDEQNGYYKYKVEFLGEEQEAEPEINFELISRDEELYINRNSEILKNQVKSEGDWVKFEDYKDYLDFDVAIPDMQRAFEEINIFDRGLDPNQTSKVEVDDRVLDSVLPFEFIGGFPNEVNVDVKLKGYQISQIKLSERIGSGFQKAEFEATIKFEHNLPRSKRDELNNKIAEI